MGSPDILITDDYYMRHPGVTTQEDNSMLGQGERAISLVEVLEMAQDLPEEERKDLPPEPTPGFFKMNPGDLKTMMKAAGRTATEFSVEARKIMTEARAVEVRDFRCKKKHSWRALALQCHGRWGGRWAPASNQIMGIELCVVAAEILGEDCHELPWNDL